MSKYVDSNNSSCGIHLFKVLVKLHYSRLTCNHPLFQRSYIQACNSPIIDLPLRIGLRIGLYIHSLLCFGYFVTEVGVYMATGNNNKHEYITIEHVMVICWGRMRCKKQQVKLANTYSPLLTNRRIQGSATIERDTMEWKSDSMVLGRCWRPSLVNGSSVSRLS